MPGNNYILNVIIYLYTSRASPCTSLLLQPHISLAKGNVEDIKVLCLTSGHQDSLPSTLPSAQSQRDL